MIGRCEAWDLVLPVPDDGGEPVATRCPNSGRRIQETDPLGRPRHRTVCGPHGLDTAPPSAILPEDDVIAILPRGDVLA